jgi:hypothetical protein
MEDLKRLAAREYEMGMDYCFVMPLTPNPGTEVAEEAKRSGRIANHDLASYNFATPVCVTDTLDLSRTARAQGPVATRRHRRREEPATNADAARQRNTHDLLE